MNTQGHHLLKRLLTGTIAGVAATAAMTAAMEALFQRLPRHERYPLPPREITEGLAARAGINYHLNEKQRANLALTSHYAYGAAAGALYALLLTGRPLPPAMRGTGYGLAVWSASYLGWTPAFDILRPATQHPARRNALMITAHVVWGSVLGLGVHRMGEMSQRRSA